MAYFDFEKCELCFLVPKDIMHGNRWGNVPEGVEVDLSKVTDNAALGIAELATTTANNARQEIADYTKVVMDKIDDAKERGAVNDLSVIAYALVNKLISATSAIA